ncbi:uncharacterized protein B0P05DRAFT_591265 [Gilbertella persicaria]|uniref:uncharacterized protein n=1 Tax=Gilbertella persicaria TaxID=101096 RepID=UPI0022205939|nr:uncharacterized protein B0P05DRAFT_591265 [Gilbertella persicaria]KAI8057570.1 hypothetical protein B0P05DRAFT_591265 [Gilbertella persicaria]
MSTVNQQTKRKNEDILEKENNDTKRIHTLDYLASPPEDHVMEDTPLSPIMRPTTPPLGMTLCHYNANTGSYTSSQINSNHEVKSQICTGMTPVYRAPFERWGSCLI